MGALHTKRVENIILHIFSCEWWHWGWIARNFQIKCLHVYCLCPCRKYFYHISSLVPIGWCAVCNDLIWMLDLGELFTTPHDRHSRMVIDDSIIWFKSIQKCCGYKYSATLESKLLPPNLKTCFGNGLRKQLLTKRLPVYNLHACMEKIINWSSKLIDTAVTNNAAVHPEKFTNA